MSHISSIRSGSLLRIRRHDYLAILRVGSTLRRLGGVKEDHAIRQMVVWQIFGQKDPPPDWFILILNAVSHVSPKADHETNKGVSKAFAVGLYFARTKHLENASLDLFCAETV